MPNETKKTLSQKINEWRIGRTPYSVGKLIGQYARKQKLRPKPKELDPTPLARLFNFVIRFWGNHWQWIVGITISSIIGIVGLYLLWLQLIAMYK